MKVNSIGRATGVLAFSTIALLGISACSAGGGSEDGGSEGGSSALTVWVDSERVDALTDVVAEYTEKTGIEIELVGKNVDDVKDVFIQQEPSG